MKKTMIWKNREIVMTAALWLVLALLCVYFVFEGLGNGKQILSAAAALPGPGLLIAWGVSAACLATTAFLGRGEVRLLWLNLCLMALCACMALLKGDMTAALIAAFVWGSEGFLTLRQARSRGKLEAALCLPALLFAWYMVILFYDLVMR